MANDPFVPVWPDAAADLNLTKDQAYKQARTGRLVGLEVHKRGRTPVVLRADLDRLLGRRASPSPLTVIPAAGHVSSPPDPGLLRRTASYLDREIERTTEHLAFLEWQRTQVAKDLAALEAPGRHAAAR